MVGLSGSEILQSIPEEEERTSLQVCGRRTSWGKSSKCSGVEGETFGISSRENNEADVLEQSEVRSSIS